MHSINKIKEHRHSKIKEKHIDKFKCLYYKRFQYHHNFTRNMQNFDNIDQDPTLSGHLNVLSSFSTTPLKPAALHQLLPHPRPLYLLQVQTQYPQHPSQHLGTLPPVPWIHAKLMISPKSGSSTFPKPPYSRSAVPSTKGPQLCHNTQVPPMEAYITVVEQASSKLPTQKADELRSDVSCLLRQHHTQHKNHCSLNPTQCRALTQLKQDTSRVVLTADKGVAMVIMDKQDYINKANILLQDTNTYNVLKKDPTSHLKNKLITILKEIKQKGGLNNTKYKQLYPTSSVPSQILWPSQNSQNWHPS